ncbi:hypothetical protein FB446DRAFT_848745 [Lentinula raphanica]|nr:hypothetical protein FB446DRAFT_848745 [Lentinula raphanica]
MLRRSQRVKDKKDASSDIQSRDMSTLSPDSDAALQYTTRDDEDEDKEYEEEEQGDEDYTEEQDEDIPKRKKSRKTVSTKRQRVPEQFRKVRGKLGLLEKLAKEMPLDVILEIFCYLEPRDLLRLARTTRDLRGILMSKSRESIWRTARGNVEGLPGLPPPPADLNEPQYANLAFENYCHVCMRTGRSEILWNLRMRSCQKCLQTFPNLLEVTIPDHPLNDDIFPSELVTVNLCWSNFRVLYMVLKFQVGYRKVGNPTIIQRYKTEYDALKTQEEREAWIVCKKNECLAVKEHSQRCQIWYLYRLKNRATELDALRKKRKEAILDRLEEIGWRDEAELILEESFHNYDAFSMLKPVRQAKKLTDYGWHCIKDEIVKFLSDRREERIAQEHRDGLPSLVWRVDEIYEYLLSISDLREPYPTVGDVLCNQAYQSYIRHPPPGVTGGTARVKLEELLPEILNDWRAAKVQKLVEIMRKSRPTATDSDLHLATTMFECKECSGPPLYYPQIFYHSCCTRRRTAPANGPMDLLELLPVDGKGPWSHLSIKFSDTYSDHARALVLTCSLDPNVATFKDMCDANPLFECTTCERDLQYPDGGRYFMRWPIPLIHDRTHALVVNNLSEEEKKAIDVCEPNISSQRPNPICCAHCHEKANPGEFYYRHLKSSRHRDLIEYPEPKEFPKLQALYQHWYWNPRTQLDGLGEPFRYRKDSATAAVVALED